MGTRHQYRCKVLGFTRHYNGNTHEWYTRGIIRDCSTGKIFHVVDYHAHQWFGFGEVEVTLTSYDNGRYLVVNSLTSH